MNNNSGNNSNNKNLYAGSQQVDVNSEIRYSADVSNGTQNVGMQRKPVVNINTMQTAPKQESDLLPRNNSATWYSNDKNNQASKK